MKLTDIFVDLKIIETDNRKRIAIAPERIVKTFGSVTGESSLLSPQYTQPFLSGAIPVAVLKNIGECHAAVLLDFGRELHGSLRVTSGVSSGNILIRLGESASEAVTPLGIKNTTNDHANRDMQMNIGLLSANETNESGFRFAYIELLGDDTELALASVAAIFIYNDLEYKGSFKCSDPEVNRIFDTAVYTVHLNLQNYLWDGIKRDRLTWVGDMNTEILTALSVFGPVSQITRSLDSVRDLTPPNEWMNGISSYSIWWVICHYDYFMASGDLSYLSAQKDYMKELLGILAGFVGENGSEELPPHRFIDWPNSANPEAQHAGLQGLLRAGLVKGAFLMNVLGEAGMSVLCLDKALLMQKHVPDPNGSKQAASLMTFGGIGDPSELYDKTILPGAARGYSTFLGYYTLAAAPFDKLSSALSHMKQYWGTMLSMGATTFWEDFNIEWAENAFPITELPSENEYTDIHGDFGAYCYEKFRHSLCHGWASGPAPWLMKYILGINILEPGCRKINVIPNLAGLSYAEGYFPTPLGNLYVSHKLSGDGSVISQISAPDGIEIIRV